MRKHKQEKEVHSHRFSRVTQDEFRCISLYNGNPCIALGVGQDEYDRRILEWDSYFKLVKTTPAYLDFLEISQAWKAHDTAKVKEINKKILGRSQVTKNNFGEKIIEPNYDLMPKPDIPDPHNSKSIYIILEN